MVEAGSDSLEVLEWVNHQRDYLTRVQRKALFDARLEGRFEQALIISGMSRKKALAATREENRTRGKLIRWGSSST